MNTYVKIGLFGGAVFGLYKLLEMANVADKATFDLKNPRIHKVDYSGVVFRTEIDINNKTRGRMTITKPVVTITSREQYVTESKAEDKTFTIEAQTQTTIDTIEIVIPWGIIGKFIKNILTRIPKIIAAYKAKGDKKTNVAKAIGIPLEMKFSTYANGIFYQSPITKIL